MSRLTLPGVSTDSVLVDGRTMEECLNRLFVLPVRRVVCAGIRTSAPAFREIWLTPERDEALRDAGYDHEMQKHCMECAVEVSFANEIDARWKSSVPGTRMGGLKTLASTFARRIIDRRRFPEHVRTSLEAAYVYGQRISGPQFSLFEPLATMAKGGVPHVVPMGRLRHDPETYLVFYWGASPVPSVNLR